MDTVKEQITLVRPLHAYWYKERTVYTAMVLIIVIVGIVLRSHALFVSSIDRDESLYLVMAQRWLVGALPYVAVWDQHPPGLPALLTVFEAIIPDPVLAARLAATGAVIMTALLIHRFCARYLNRADTGFIAALLYIMCISRWLGLAANTEVFNNACVTCAAYLLYGSASQSSRAVWKAVLAAVILGIGLQIKYVIFPEAVLLCLGYLTALRQQKRDLRLLIAMAGLLSVVGILPTGITILYFWLHGALQPFIDANLGSNLAYLKIMLPLSDVLRSSISGMTPMIGSILIISYVLMGRSFQSLRWHRFFVLSPQNWLLLWAVAAVIDVCMPLKFWTHYYFALYPPACIAGAMALSIMARGTTKPFIVGLVILFIGAVPLWIAGKEAAVLRSDPDAPRAVAEYLRHAGASKMQVFVYDYQPVVYALAQLQPPTAYVLDAELTSFSVSAHVDGKAEIQHIMNKLPQFVVLRTNSLDKSDTADVDEIVTNPLKNYDLVYEVADKEFETTVRIYRRQSSQPVSCHIG